MRFLLGSALWDFFFSPTGFIQHNWKDLGGPHFIAVCTALNLAVIGWKQFRKEHIWEAEMQMTGKISSIRLSLAESDSGKALRIFGDLILGPLLFLNRWGWRLTYTFVIIASGAGLLMLWAGKSCPYDILLLLLPSFLQVSLSLVTVLAIMFWTMLMKRGLAASEKVNKFLDSHKPPPNEGP